MESVSSSSLPLPPIDWLTLTEEKLESLLPTMSDKEAEAFLAHENCDIGEFSPTTRESLLSQAYPNISPPLRNTLLAPYRLTPPESIYPRKYPRRGSTNDTLGKRDEMHLFFQDSDILHVEPLELTNIKNGVRIFSTPDQRLVIKQQALKGCTAAATAMLCLPHNPDLDISYLRTRHVGHHTVIKDDIMAAKLTALTINLPSQLNPLPKIKHYLETNGPAIIHTNDESLGTHVIVVDAITGDGVDLRDPYHGWAIQVTHEAFMRVKPDSQLVQVSKV